MWVLCVIGSGVKSDPLGRVKLHADGGSISMPIDMYLGDILKLL